MASPRPDSAKKVAARRPRLHAQPRAVVADDQDGVLAVQLQADHDVPVRVAERVGDQFAIDQLGGVEVDRRQSRLAEPVPECPALPQHPLGFVLDHPHERHGGHLLTHQSCTGVRR